MDHFHHCRKLCFILLFQNQVGLFWNLEGRNAKSSLWYSSNHFQLKGLPACVLIWRILKAAGACRCHQTLRSDCTLESILVVTPHLSASFKLVLRLTLPFASVSWDLTRAPRVCGEQNVCSTLILYMCIFHYFNYYLPDFVTAVCLGFIFGFSFWGICFNLTQCHNKPLVESLFLTRDQAPEPLEWEHWFQDPRQLEN